VEVSPVQEQLHQVLFTFKNNVGIASSITDVYFDDGTLLAMGQITSSTGVSFTALASPGDLPGHQDVNPPFVTTQGFSLDSTSGQDGVKAHGVDAATEWLSVLFTLQGTQTYADTLAALANGSLRIGLHVQAIGATETFDGGSDSYVNTVSVVPVPGAVLLGFLGLSYAGMRLRRTV
jgi:hypothetical protein